MAAKMRKILNREAPGTFSELCAAAPLREFRAEKPS